MTTRTCALLWLAAGAACAAPADSAWQAILALEAGPQVRPRSAAEAQAAILGHLANQERALRSFLAAHPADTRAFEAQLRLSRLFALRGDMQGDEKARTQAARLLAALEKDATPEQRTELDFARLAQAMRKMNAASRTDRDAVLAQVRKFQTAHPEDRRLAEALAEVAALFDAQPKTALQLLLEAQGLAQDERLKTRIADDLRRVGRHHETLALSAPGLAGKALNVADYRGRPVLICFFAVWSEPALLALDTIKRAVDSLPKDAVQVLGVSLDTKPEALTALLKEKGLAWPVACDQQGWESPLIRELGINSLPTVWLLDRAGKLRSLDALENPVGQIRQLLGER